MPHSNPNFRTPAGTAKMSLPLAMSLSLSALLISGCGGGDQPHRVPVGGYVSFDGGPLKSGSVRFIPTDGTTGPAAVAAVDEGFFELPADAGPVLGKNRIEIEANNHLGFAIDDEQAYAQRVERGEQIPKNPVPDTCNQLSTLVVELPEDGNSELEFKLTSAGIMADSR